MNLKHSNAKTQPVAKLWQALIPVAVLIVSLSVGIIVYDSSPHIPLIIASISAAIMALSIGYKWTDIEKGFIESIQMSMQAVIILMIIGTIIGAWILSGTVQTMIYYGLKLLSPSIFLVATCIICGIVSLATGSSWTTAGTVGIALIGVGMGLGIPKPMIAGAIISGAYFGDKISPLSDTTNLAPAMAGSTLFEHIKHMFYTTIPALIITLIAYGFIGAKFSGGTVDSSMLNDILTSLKASCTISPLLFIPPIAVIVLVIKKVPAIPGLIIGAVIGCLMAVIMQGATYGDIVNVLNNGYESNLVTEAEYNTSIENAGTDIDTEESENTTVVYGLSEKNGGEVVMMVNDLLTRGGIQGMMYTVSLILCAMIFGGIMEKSGFLGIIAEKLLKFAVSTGSLILITIISCISVNILAGDQYLSIVIPGRMYKKEYEKRGLASKNLSRCLEDAGTMTSAFIPWNTCGAFMSSTLGVSCLAYGPFCILNYLIPVISVIYGFTGFSIAKANTGCTNSAKQM